MRIVVQSPKEKQLLVKLVDFLSKKNMNFILEFEDPLSFQIEEVMDELCSCDIEVDKKEEPMALSV
ncbi:MAG: hypothetical protein H7647_08085 [Candidatus Heimdallarchaeota archaeon]|jgi:hypothetical protein|nr:hypothetical protein [Candidatus Heimdallarchaeota archaeon]MCK4254386.1 hypothetical protein [Candidatus Heimdallarchaeota archaeon]